MCGALRKNLHIIPKGGIGLKLNFASFSTESLLQFAFVWTIIVPQKNTSSRGWVSRKTDIRLNKIMGCESPRCRRCKCRDSLPLTKVSHWRNPRRQTGHRLRHKSEDLREWINLFCTRAMGKEVCYVTQKNGCGSILYCRSFFVWRWKKCSLKRI